MIQNIGEGMGFPAGINIHRRNYFDVPAWKRPFKGLTIVIGDHVFGMLKIFPKKNKKKGWGWVHLCRWSGHPWEKVRKGEVSCSRCN